MTTKIVEAVRYHDISCGHRVSGHESKCAFLHGHNYRITFYCEPEKSLDQVGRVLDFSVIKSLLCMWLENNWDHRFLAFKEDPIMTTLFMNSRKDIAADVFAASIVWVPFNPTAENMAQYLLDVVGPQQLANTGVILTKVVVEETRKCSATASKKRLPISYYETEERGDWDERQEDSGN